jgi:structural maintenance of chromosome 2
MQYVFGEAFVCEDSETAKKLAFDPRVNMLCVTIEGDVYSP